MLRHRAQPFGRQVKSAHLGVLDHVAGDIGELKRQPKVRSAAQGGDITHAHDLSHHHADHPRDVIGIEQGVLKRSISAPFHVHAEALQQIERMLGWNAMSLRDPLEGGKGGIVSQLAGHCAARLVLQLRKLARGQDRIEADRAVAHDLTVDLVVAMPAPSVEHVCIFADARVEQTRGSCEAGRAASDAVAAGVEDGVVQ